MPARDHRQRFRRQAIDPLIGGNRLPGLGIGPKPRPVAFFLYLLVGNGAFDHQHERIQLSLLRHVPEFQEVVSVLVGQNGIVQVHLGQAGNCPQQNVFDTGLGCRGDRNRISVAAQPGGDPENVDFGDWRRFLRLPTVWNRFRCHSWTLLSRLDLVRTGVAEFLLGRLADSFQTPCPGSSFLRQFSR